jgi:hypothetical protein
VVAGGGVREARDRHDSSLTRRTHAGQGRRSRGPHSVLKEHPIVLPVGRTIDASDAVALAEAVAERASRGRPSLTAAGTHSPRISVRLPEDVFEHFTLYARLTKTSVSAIARRALLDFDAEIVAATSEESDVEANARALSEAASLFPDRAQVSTDGER